MRVSSLVMLAAVVLTTLYFIFLTPDWAKDLYLRATGYGPAKDATEAVDKFLKAVRKRDLATASRFCTGDYASQLKRGATVTKELGPILDDIHEYMKSKGLVTDKSVNYLHLLDPFPTNISMASEPKAVDATKAKGFVKMDNIWTESVQRAATHGSLSAELRLDQRMFNRVFMPYWEVLLNPKGFDIVKEGNDWKLSFPLAPGQVEFMDYYLNNYKAYHTRLSTFRRDMTNDRYDSKQKFEGELVQAMQESK